MNNKRPHRNNTSVHVEDWTTLVLMNTTRALFSSIYQAQCFSARDVKNYQVCVLELEKRGYELQIHEALFITKAKKGE